MRFPRVAFVAAPAAAPQVLLELNEEDPLYLLGGETGDFTLGSPAFDADPFAVGRDYGPREPSGTLRVKGTSAVVSAAMSALGRRLLAPRSWLMFQRDAASQPVFARVYASAPGVLEWRNAGSGVYDVPLSLVADPFLYGARETLGPVNVPNNPSAAGGCLWRLPAIKGDAEAPLRVQIKAGLATATRLVLTTTRFAAAPANYVAPYRVPTASWVNGVDTTPAATLSTMVDSDSRITLFPNANDAVRVTFPTGGVIHSAAAAVALPPGVYRAWMRVHTNSPATFTFRLGQFQAGGSRRLNDKVTWAPAEVGVVAYVDLGLLYHPPGGILTVEELDTYAGYALPTLNFDISAALLAGAASLRWDDMLLIPVEPSTDPDATRSAVVEFATFSTGTPDSYIVDGELRSTRTIDTTPATVVVTDPSPLKGGWPRAVPGSDNLLHLLPRANNDDKALVSVVSASYLPRYLHLRPDGG